MQKKTSKMFNDHIKTKKKKINCVVDLLLVSFRTRWGHQSHDIALSWMYAWGMMLLLSLLVLLEQLELLGLCATKFLSHQTYLFFMFLGILF